MKTGPQDNIRKLIENVKLPKIAKVRQHFDESHIEDVAGTTAAKLREQGLEERIKPGMRVVLTGSSRYIADAVPVLRETARFVRECGGEPVIIPAMGSHGGATAEGQREILTEYGITEESCGCRIYSSMETVLTGHTPDGLPVYIDKFAKESDAIIPIGRIKAHTAFRARYESGLMKMCAIGLGKQYGADALHNAGFGEFKTRIPAYGNTVIATNNVIFAVGIIENAFDKTCRIEVVKGEEIADKEPALLEYAKSRMAKIFVDETDLLVVREIGKNISGSGMDPNITGTWSTPYGGGGLKKQRVTVLDLTDESKGNALGIGRADTTTMRVFDKIDFTQLYPNLLTSTVVSPGMIPMVLEDDKMAITAAIKMLTGVDKDNVRVVMIKNTLSLSEIYLSEALLPQAEADGRMEVLEEPHPMEFDADGALRAF